MEETQNFLATERVGRLMTKYAVPCIISLLVGALYITNHCGVFSKGID